MTTKTNTTEEPTIKYRINYTCTIDIESEKDEESGFYQVDSYCYDQNSETFNTFDQLTEWITDRIKYHYESGETTLEWIYVENPDGPTNPIKIGLCIDNINESINDNNLLTVTTDTTCITISKLIIYPITAKDLENKLTDLPLMD